MSSLSWFSVRRLLVNVVDAEIFVFKKYIGVRMVLPVLLTQLESRCLNAGSSSRREILAVRGVSEHGERDALRFAGENLKRPLLDIHKQIFPRIPKASLRTK